jgi:hypothetical protein
MSLTMLIVGVNPTLVNTSFFLTFLITMSTYVKNFCFMDDDGRPAKAGNVEELTPLGQNRCRHFIMYN